MKLREAIDRIDSLKHNTYTTAEKVEWISRLDGTIKEQIFDTHEGPEAYFQPYDVATDMDTDLLVMAPYEEVYIRWLEAQIDYYNGEIMRYNNSMAMFQAAYSSYANAYNRKYMPKAQTMVY